MLHDIIVLIDNDPYVTEEHKLKNNTCTCIL